MDLDSDLEEMDHGELVDEVRKLRAGIREHRDSSGHDLCWHHPQLWGLLPERIDPKIAVPEWPQFLRGCVRYRQSLDEQRPEAPRAAEEYDLMVTGTGALRPRSIPVESERAARMKRGFCDDIERLTIDNEDFRRVLYTGGRLQLVVMTLQSGEEIGEEVHSDRDQFFRFEEGQGAVDIDGRENPVMDDFAVIVPAGARHNVRNTGSQPLRFYTIYGPPEHKDRIVQRTKEEAEARHHLEEWNGATTE